MYVTLNEAKRHLNIEITTGITEDDLYILSLIDAAEGAVSAYICDDLQNILITGKTIPELFYDDEFKLATEDGEQIVTETGEELISEDAVENYKNILVTGGTSLPTPIIQAILLMVGNFYANREPIAFAKVEKIPLTYEYLLSLFKHYE